MNFTKRLSNIEYSLSKWGQIAISNWNRIVAYEKWSCANFAEHKKIVGNCHFLNLMPWFCHFCLFRTKYVVTSHIYWYTLWPFHKEDYLYLDGPRYCFSRFSTMSQKRDAINVLMTSNVLYIPQLVFPFRVRLRCSLLWLNNIQKYNETNTQENNFTILLRSTLVDLYKNGMGAFQVAYII